MKMSPGIRRTGPTLWVLAALHLALLFPAAASALPQALSPDPNLFEVLTPTPGGTDVTVEPRFRLTGTYDPMRVASLRVNGVPLPASSLDPDRGLWELESQDLVPGFNRYALEAWGPGPQDGPLAAQAVDLWYETGETTVVQGTLQAPDLPHPGPTLEILCPDRFLPGFPLPLAVILRQADGGIDRDRWQAEAAIAFEDPAAGTAAPPSIPLFNGRGSTRLAPATAGSETLTLRVGTLTASRSLSPMDPAQAVEQSGLLDADTVWAGLVRVTGDLELAAERTLEIEPGTWVLLDPGVNLRILGTLVSLGTATQPVVITGRDAERPWGQIRHEGGPSSHYAYTLISGGGDASSQGHTHGGPALRVEDTAVIFENCLISDLAGKVLWGEDADLTWRSCHLARAVMGPEVAGTALSLTDTWITEMHGPDDDDGLYVRAQHSGQPVRIEGCVVADVDDDGIDTLGSDVTIRDCILRDCADKGISLYDGSAHLESLLLVDCGTGVGAKARDHVTMPVHADGLTTAGCGIGVHVREKYSGPETRILLSLANSIIRADEPIRNDLRAEDLTVTDCLVGSPWPGRGTLPLDPRFRDPARHDYRLQLTSPAVATGHRDGRAVDRGARPTTESLAPLGVVRWTAEQGPYLLQGEVTVPQGLTLVIEPGTSVLCDDDARLAVRGRLLAEGTADRRIFFTRPPDSLHTWDGLWILGSEQDNRIAWAILSYGRDDDGMLHVEDGRLTISDSAFADTDLRSIHSLDSSLVVERCTFADIFGPDEKPTTDNRSEHIWGRGIPEGGRWVVRDCLFGTARGHNDVIDFDGEIGDGLVMQIRDNHVLGSGDDALDIGGDAFVTGNRFEHIHKDRYNHAPRNGNVISAGLGGDCVAVRNVFYDVDQVVQVKEGVFLTFTSNTVAAAAAEALYFELPGQTHEPGRGAAVDGCIFWRTPVVLAQTDHVEQLRIDHSLLPAAWHAWGEGNLEADPRFAAPPASFALAGDSPAVGAGPWGLDMGAVVPAGPVVVPGDEPGLWAVGGPGITGYCYAANDPNGPWQGPYDVDETLALDASTTQVWLLGRDAAGIWQDPAEAVAVTLP